MRVLSVNLKTAKALALLRAVAETLTKIDLINRTLAIQQTQSGTTGANTGGAAEEFIAQDGHSLCDGSLLDGCAVQHRAF
jgi:hypothetical protein